MLAVRGDPERYHMLGVPEGQGDGVARNNTFKAARASDARGRTPHIDASLAARYDLEWTVRPAAIAYDEKKPTDVSAVE